MNPGCIAADEEHAKHAQSVGPKSGEHAALADALIGDGDDGGMTQERLRVVQEVEPQRHKDDERDQRNNQQGQPRQPPSGPSGEEAQRRMFPNLPPLPHEPRHDDHGHETSGRVRVQRKTEQYAAQNGEQPMWRGRYAPVFGRACNHPFAALAGHCRAPEAIEG